MKTLIKDKEVVRKDDETACDMVKNGWAYCSKSVWKKIRGAVKIETKAEETDQPWKEKRRRTDVKKVSKEVTKNEPKELTAVDIMAGGDKVMQQAMEITGQEDKKGKRQKGKGKK